MSDQPSPWIVEVNDETFAAEVLDASKDGPVVVDFWSENCQPCLMLKPILHQAAERYAGKFRLVTANTNQAPSAAMQFGVQSIPAVFAVLDGQVIDHFGGLMPEPMVAQWLDRVVAQHEVAALADKESQDPAAAEAEYRRLLQERPDDPELLTGLARVLLALDRDAECGQVIGKLEARGFLEPAAEQVKSAWHLRSQRGVDLDALREQVRRSPADFPAWIRLGEALAANQQYQEALEMLLQVVEQDRRGEGDHARQKMLEVFRVLGDDSQLVRDFRRRLSSALY